MPITFEVSLLSVPTFVDLSRQVMEFPIIEVQSPNIRYTDKYIEADYKYDTTVVKKEKGVIKVSSEYFSYV